MRVGLLLTGLALAFVAGAQDRPNTVRAGFAVNPIGAGLLAEYERKIDDAMSLGVRLASIDYEWKDGAYREEGDAQGVDVLARYYFQRSGFRGWYLGGGFGYYESDWDWREPGAMPSSGRGSSELWNIALTGGYKHFFRPNFYADIFALAGRWEGKSTSETTGTRKTQLGAYFGAGAALGLTF